MIMPGKVKGVTAGDFEKAGRLFSQWLDEEEDGEDIMGQ